MKITIIIISAWVVIILGIALFNVLSPEKSQVVPEPSSDNAVVQRPAPSFIDTTPASPSVTPDSNNAAPTDQPPLVFQNKPEEAVKLFFSLIDQGKLEGAVSMIEPNYMLLVISGNKDLPALEVMHSYVRLFDKGSLQSVDFTPPKLPGNPDQFEADATVLLKDGTKYLIHFGMHYLALDQSVPKTWYFKNLEIIEE